MGDGGRDYTRVDTVDETGEVVRNTVALGGNMISAYPPRAIPTEQSAVVLSLNIVAVSHLSLSIR